MLYSGAHLLPVNIFVGNLDTTFVQVTFRRLSGSLHVDPDRCLGFKPIQITVTDALAQILQTVLFGGEAVQ